MSDMPPEPIQVLIWELERVQAHLEGSVLALRENGHLRTAEAVDGWLAQLEPRLSS